jgi:Ca-activated chloride channel family protein
MKTWTEREVKDLLTPDHLPKPPAGLAERIKAEIPDEADKVVPFRKAPRSRLRPLLMAASLLTVVGAAFLVYRLQIGTGLEPQGHLVAAQSELSPEMRSNGERGRFTEDDVAAVPPAAVPPAAVTPVAVAPLPSPSPSPGVDAGAGLYTGELTLESSPKSKSDAKLRVLEAGRRSELERRVSPEKEDFAFHAEVSPPSPGLPAPAPPPPPASLAPPRSRASQKAAPPLRSARQKRVAGSQEARGNASIARENEQISSMDKEAAELEAQLKKLDTFQGQLREELAVTSESPRVAPSTGGTTEPNDAPYGDVFFDSAGTNPFIDTEDDQLSTFGLDVDTASYTVVRRYLSDGHLPPPEAVRVEELVNYFDYGDASPEEEDFALHAEGAPSPFGEGERYYLLRFHLAGRELDAAERRPANLTFVVDVSGSMARENRLGLVQRALGLLIDELRPDDRVALVVYGTRGRVLLEPTADHGRLRQAITELRPEGATNAEEGLTLAYSLAARESRRGVINRVILCSDGVANVGDTSAELILQRVESQAGRGVELTTVGFGMGNYNDVLMEQLADRGNGRYAYVDTLEEAQKIFVENLTGTLQTIAAEARVQVDFNPDVVDRYRLLGYENRDIADDRFRDDTVDAGEIGAGHTVTALYEIKLHARPSRRDEIATLHLRYGSVIAGKMVELERRVYGNDFAGRFEDASKQLRLTALVAEFAEILKRTYWAKTGDPDDLFRRAQKVSAEYSGDHDVAEFVTLVSQASRARKP